MRVFMFVFIMSGITFVSFVFAQSDIVVQYQPAVSLDGVFDAVRQSFTGVMKNGYALFISLVSIWLGYRVIKMLLDDKGDQIDVSGTDIEVPELPESENENSGGC